MKKIRGVVFDFGGVISIMQEATFYPAVEALTGWNRETVKAGWKRHRLLMDADEISVQALYRRIADDLGQTFDDEVYEELKRLDYEAWSVPNPATIAWGKALKAQGYKIGILTNMPVNFVPWFDRCARELRAIADAEVISGAEHIIKPDPAIYALMVERIGLPPEELFFFDDSPVNVEAARQCGWSAAVFTTPEAAAQALAQA